MDLIERLRPKWRHPDPEVRAAAVGEIAEDRARLGAIARDDPDPRVRRAAIEMLDDLGVLEHAAANDADQAVREFAAERLREALVAVACSDRPIGDCETALARLWDMRSLAAVATNGSYEAVRHAALTRVSGDRMLRDVVRHATDPEIRRAALDRISDADMLRAIAENHDASKSVRHQARERLATVLGGRLPVGFKEGRARQLELCTAVHALRAETDVMAAAGRVAEAQHEWRDLARDVDPRDDVAERFKEACDEILAAAALLDRRRAEVENAQTAIEQGLTSRRALCERVEALDGGDALHELVDARSAWSRLPSVPGPEGVDLARRFSAAGRECEARHERWQAGASLHSRLEALAQEAERLAGSSPLPKLKVWKSLEERWATLEAAADGTDVPRERLDAAREKLNRRQETAEKQQVEQQRQNLARLEALHARVLELTNSEALKPSAGRRQVETVDAALRDLGPLPASERRAAWAERLTEARGQLLRRLGEVEETEEWRRWANATAQEEIIQRVEGLLESNDLAEGTRVLGRLQQEWEKVATVSPDKSRVLWERFRTARNELRKRCDAFMAENLAKKRALCEQVAGLGESTAWKETTDLLRRLQAEWKEIGPIPGRYAKELWHQFREPCERFFARRKEQFDRADGERRENAAKKVALCEQAEAVADSTDWDATATVLRQLQGDWKRIGPAPREENETLWQRFRGACDRFFDRHRRRDELAREAAAEKAQAICAEMEALATSIGGPDAEPAETIATRVDAAWGEWLRLDVGTFRDAASLEERLRAACDRIAAVDVTCLRGTRLDPEATRKRREKLCTRLEELVAGLSDAPQKLSLQEMALALRERLATNTIAGTGSAAERKKEAAREAEKIAAAWARLGPVVGEAARGLAERYEAARVGVGRNQKI